MAFQRMGYIGKSFTMGAVGILATLVACGGGGVTNINAGPTVASPYVLFASSYTPNAAAANDLKWSTAQGGDVYMGSSVNYKYGQYGIFAQNDIDYHQSVGIQFFHDAALTATDYIYMKIQAPVNASVDVSQSGKLMIQMGNDKIGTDQTNTPTKFTVELNGGTYSTTNYTYANSCSTEVQLTEANPTLNKLRTYSVPLSGLTCSAGTLATLKSDLKAVVVKVLAGKEAGKDLTTTNNYVLPKVGLVAFSL